MESGLKYKGDQYQNHVVKGDTLPPPKFIPAALQREVLGLLIDSIAPEALAIHERCWRS